MHRWTKGSIVLLLVAAATLGLPATSGAAIITPNTTTDHFNADPANCSLREAVDAADDNSNAEAPGCTAGDAAMDTIQLAPGTYELTIPQDNGLPEDVASGDLAHSSALRVESVPGTTDPVTIDVNQTDRVFQSFGNLTIDGVTLTGGFVDNPATGAAVTGGAIATSGGTAVTLTDTALVGNRADGSGGALAANGPTSLMNVTVSGNESTEQGGAGVQIGGMNTLVLDHVTITDNDAVTNGTASGGEFGGGVAAVNLATATVHNSIIAGNTENTSADNEPNCSGPVSSTGGNVIGTIGDCAFTQDPDPGDDQVNVADPGLAAVGDNGGPSQTHALMAGSPAIAQGVATCQATDQRGILRGVAVCDAGAFEVDTDTDTVGDNADNCPMDVNANQANNDGDAQGDVCDTDDDNDTVEDTVETGCPTTAGPGISTDSDSDDDGVADGPDVFPCDPDESADTDGDTFGDNADNCPAMANADQANNDADAQGDVCDNCAAVANSNQANNDGDAQGDACDADDDNDAVADAADNCALIANADQGDNDADGIGNVCDPTPNPPTIVPTALAPEPPAECAALRAKLKKAKSKKKKRKIRKQLRRRGC